MTIKLAQCLAIALFIVIAATTSFGQDEQPTDATVEKEITQLYIVKLSTSENRDAIFAELTELGGTVVDELPLIDAVVVQYKNSDAESAIRALNLNPAIEYTEPVYELHAFGKSSRDPNDPSFPNQWGLKEINAPSAWQRPTASNYIIVAVIDSGVDYTHPDLAKNMWRNANERPGDGVDNDRNGIVDDVYGADFTARGKPSGDPKDRNGHGTHVAGIIGAVSDNMEGVAGTVWKTRIMALKFMKQSRGNTADAVKAIAYAISENANVINASFGSDRHSRALEDAIRRANDARVMVVAAAGNDNTNNDNKPIYPANYDVPNVISVMAVNKAKTKASFSNFGEDTVDIAAPGQMIYSTDINKTYSFKRGTSMAAPFVAGAAALMFAREDLRFANPEQVKELLVRTGKNYCFPPQPKSCQFANQKVLHFRSLNLGKAIYEPPKGECPPGVMC